MRELEVAGRKCVPRHKEGKVLDVIIGPNDGMKGVPTKLGPRLDNKHFSVRDGEFGSSPCLVFI